MTGHAIDPSPRPAWLENEALAACRKALEEVIDPELGYNIVGLGLVYGVTAEPGGRIVIAMTTTTIGCPATDYLLAGARNSVSSLPGVASVDVNLTYDPPWTPEMMEAAARRYFGMG